jgi:hypothetical protein
MTDSTQPLPGVSRAATAGTALRSAARRLLRRFVGEVDETAPEIDELHRLAAEIFWWDPRTTPR